jgi:hypothetical protein
MSLFAGLLAWLRHICDGRTPLCFLRLSWLLLQAGFWLHFGLLYPPWQKLRCAFTTWMHAAGKCLSPFDGPHCCVALTLRSRPTSKPGASTVPSVCLYLLAVSACVFWPPALPEGPARLPWLLQPSSTPGVVNCKCLLCMRAAHSSIKACATCLSSTLVGQLADELSCREV